MSAELLREAAALMRSRAEAAESDMAGPWEAKVLTDGRAWVAGPMDAMSMHGYPSSAEYIASWHPLVALAMVDWLEAEARAMEFDIGAGLSEREAAQGFEALITVARLYLGRDS